MNKKITTQVKRLDRSRQEMLEIVRHYSHEQLSFRPGAARWSILDVINHLVLAENGIYHFMANQRDPERMPARVGWNHPLRVLLMIVTLKSPLKFKKPAKVPSPQTDKSFAQLSREWQRVGAKLSSFANSFSGDMLQKPVFFHPYFGYLNIGGTLRFLKEHNTHHLKQVKRIAASAGFPE